MCGFSHIFAGGYSAGYYVYLAAQILSADAFAAFEEAPSDAARRELGTRFATEILEVGGSRDPMESFVAFRGRKPTIDAFMKHSGLA